ncbi:antitoxin MazE family protein [Gryllotalpicola protaetiae]|uniref:DUF3018 family protein n=1 Tax=Gryllotalpicola protaetiae TaxID=2419771 RepID=A0A387BQ89_9MICO|nr:antitoxin MazE family protein [Gryllotalpicola protaetiae]AYG04838.1 DUF3018 family protein [Gryllotalpicola protaetiae]
MGTRDRVASHRDRMRKAGYRLVQTWVPDVRTPGFVDEARRQAILVAEADRRGEDQDFIEAISAPWDE